MTTGQYRQRLHPVLTDLLNRLDGTPAGDELKQRAVTVSTSTLVGEPIDHAAVLTAHRWVLDRAVGDGIALTAASYLKPADVRQLAELMPTMRDWLWAVTREIDAHPVLHFRNYLKEIGLLRKYKATLRLTRAGREAQLDPERLWQHLADTLVPTASSFIEQAGVVIMVTMATSDGRIDVRSVAQTMSEAGWSQRSGGLVDDSDIYPVWNDLWNALGNVGEPEADARRRDRALTRAARAMVHDALFELVEQ
jgi:hypothetical protein